MNLINAKSAYNNENENNNFSHVESSYEAKVATMPNGQGEDTTTFSMTTMCNPSAPESILITSIRFLDDALRLGTGDTQALVEEILIRDTPIDKETETLYHFFRTKVAPAAIGNLLGGGIDLLTSMISGNTLFSPIASFFVTGSNISLCNDYIYSTHAVFTYYTAVKYDLFR